MGLFISDSKVNNFHFRNMIEATRETFTTKNQTSDPSGHLRTTLHSISIGPHSIEDLKKKRFLTLTEEFFIK